MANGSRPSGPLTEQEILDSLKYSGFPLEIRLLHAFDEGGFDPNPPHRFLLGEGEKEKSAEIDVMARKLEVLAEHRGLLHLTLMIEAKQIQERVAFVGFKWKQPSANEMRFARARFSGLPTCNVVRTGVDGVRFSQLLLGGDMPVMAALDCLNEAPLCHQWCLVRENQKREARLEATKEDEMRLSFRKLVHATTWRERDSVGLFLRPIRFSDHLPQWRLEIMFPTIVIATPHLYTYDPLSKKLEMTSHLILREMYEVGGQIEFRYTDVVTESEVSNLMCRYREAAGQLRDAFDNHALELGRIVDEQLARQQELDAEEEVQYVLRRRDERGDY